MSLESGKYWLDNVEHFLMLKPTWVLRLTEAFLSFLFPEGCPGFCNNNGRCTLEASGWHCICQPGWRGAGCHVAMETLCTDGKDNEGGMSVRMNCPYVQRPSPRKARLQRCRTLTCTSFLLHIRCLLGRFAEKTWLQTSGSLFQFRSVSCQEPSPVSQTAWLTVWTLTAVCSFPVKTIYTAKGPLIQWRCSVSLRLH